MLMSCCAAPPSKPARRPAAEPPPGSQEGAPAAPTPAPAAPTPAPAPAAAAAGAELRAGKVCKLLLDRPKPFGFIAPAEGGPNLYFNEAQLGHQRSWAEFVGIVTKHDDCEAPVSFRIETGRGGKLQAAGVVVHDAEELAGMDADSDGTITDAELQAYLADHPELAEASLTKWEMRKRQQQAEWETRQAVNAQKHKEWEARQAAKAAKQAEWEARQAQKAREHQQREEEYGPLNYRTAARTIFS